jgi:sigma-B regulation protein RsbU (phosphoserine phosphatase)
MIMVQTAIRTLINQKETDPVKFLQVINQTIHDNVQRMNSDKNLTLSLLDYRNHRLRLSGQHESVIVARAGGAIELIDTLDLGFPIGLEENIVDFVNETEIFLETGDTVILYTDGITEAENEWGELYGLEKLCAVAGQYRDRSAREIQQKIIEDVRHHIGTQIVHDDITLVVIKRKNQDQDSVIG